MSEHWTEFIVWFAALPWFIKVLLCFAGCLSLIEAGLRWNLNRLERNLRKLYDEQGVPPEERIL